MKGCDTEVWTYWEVGTRILCNQVDVVGITADCVARLLGLNFREVVEERFDLIVLKDDYFAQLVQVLLGVVASNELKAHALELGGYDLR